MNYQANTPRRLHRSDDAILFGVCGGMAEYYDLPAWGVRLIWVLLIFPFFLFMVLSYLILGMILKKRPFQAYGERANRPSWEGARLSRGEALERLGRRMETLDKRLQRMESIITRPGFRLEDEYRRL